MQFMDKNIFMADYIDRTLTNLQCIEKNAPVTYEVTQLLNSFVGLLVLPHEKAYRSIEDSDISTELLEKIQRNVTICRNKDGKDKEKNLQNIIRHLRNGLCHFRISFYGKEEIEEIQIFDRYFGKDVGSKTIRTFEAKFDAELLREFVIEFAANMRRKCVK